MIYKYGDEKFADKKDLAIKIWKKDFRSDSCVDPSVAVEYVESTYGLDYLDRMRFYF